MRQNPARGGSPGVRPGSNVDGIFTAIFQDVQRGKVPLPSLPHLALNLRAALRQEAAGYKQLGRIIQSDPGVASYVLKLANSAARGGRYPAENLQAAINRLGVRTLVNEVTAYSLRNLFRSNTPVLREVLRSVWTRSTALAATCAVIAHRVTRQDIDRAMLAGLLAHIGALPLINAAPARLDMAVNPGLIDRVIEQYSRQVGVMMLTAWDFDEAFIDVARHREAWHHQGPPKPNLTDLVNVSALLIRKAAETDFRPPALHSVAAVTKFARTWPKTEWTPSLLTELGDQIEQAKDHLSNG